MAKIGSKAAHFLAQKPWTPWRRDNQEKVWQLEEDLKMRTQREKERAELIKKQADLEEQSRLVVALGADHTAIRESAAHPLHFMYAPPPGMAAQNPGSDANNPATMLSGSGAPFGLSIPIAVGGGQTTTYAPGLGAAKPGAPTVDATGKPITASAASSRGLGALFTTFTADSTAVAPPVQTGGDEVAAFMAKFNAAVTGAPVPALPVVTAQPASGTEAQKGGEEEADDDWKNKKLQPQTELEKLAGKKQRAAVTKEDMEARFPFLKGAPVAGDYAKRLDYLRIQPLGKSVRNVRCLRCKEWGHESSDRECPMYHFNPADADRMAREDPMAAMALADGRTDMAPHTHDGEAAVDIGSAPRPVAVDGVAVPLTVKAGALAASGLSSAAAVTNAHLEAKEWGGTDAGTVPLSRGREDDHGVHGHADRSGDGREEKGGERRGERRGEESPSHSRHKHKHHHRKHHHRDRSESRDRHAHKHHRRHKDRSRSREEKRGEERRGEGTLRERSYSVDSRERRDKSPPRRAASPPADRYAAEKRVADERRGDERRGEERRGEAGRHAGDKRPRSPSPPPPPTSKYPVDRDARRVEGSAGRAGTRSPSLRERGTYRHEDRREERVIGGYRDRESRDDRDNYRNEREYRGGDRDGRRYEDRREGDRRR